MWNQNLVSELSKGAKAERPGSLGRLAATRLITESQFWTPVWLARFIWEIIDQNAGESYYRVLDNSFGSGRLCSFATPDKWSVVGIDTDATMIGKCAELLEAHGFSFELEAGSMADVESMPQCSVATINPPFSINLQSPNLTPYPSVTTYGRFGPDTGANSHDYALAQALDYSDAVFAIVPRSLSERVQSGAFVTEHKLVACFTLPDNTFAAEGVAAVACDLLVLQLADTDAPCLKMTINQDTKAPQLPVKFRPASHLKNHSLRLAGVEDSAPKIKLPVTGIKKVRLYQKRNTIGVRFSCGQLQALCMNQLLGRGLYSTDSHRYPSHVKFEGTGRFSINAHLMNNHPLKSIHDNLVAPIASLGGQVEIDPQLLRFIRRREQQELVATTPLAKSIKTQGKGSNVLISKTSMIDPKNLFSPIVTKGQTLAVVPGKKSEFALVINNEAHDVDLSFIKTLGTVTIAQSSNWEVLHEGRLIAFPERAKQLADKAKAQGLHRFLTWDFQLNDVIELSMSHKGGALCADMGLGKSRMAIGLCMMGGQRNLLVVKSRLVPEMLRECSKIGLESVHVISGNDTDFSNLQQINIVSYETLRKQVRVKGKTVFLAALLAGRFNTVVLDEASLMGKTTSQRAAAVRALNPKKFFALDGVLVDNYPRNLLPVASLVAGQAVPSQRYSLGGEYLEHWQAKNSQYTSRGIDAFADHFVTMVWAVNQFRDGLEEGAKREVPQIKDSVLFRKWADNFVKRRVRTEPAVAKYVTIKEPIIHAPEILQWDAGHWDHYHTVATEFAHWFERHVKDQADKSKQLNLVRILAEIEAVNKAANVPHVHSEAKAAWKSCYSPLTSKQRWAIEKAKSIVAANGRALIFAQSPDVLERLAAELEKQGISVLLYTGKQSIKQRALALESQLRTTETPVQVMLATYGSGMDGINLPQFGHVILYSGSWSYRTVQQAIARTLRPEQLAQVEVHRALLAGSIDQYQDQVMSWKKNAMASGIDYADQDTETEFLHLSHIFYAFVEALKEQKEQQPLAA